APDDRHWDRSRRSRITTLICVLRHEARVAGAGFEPAKAEPYGLQPHPFDRSGTPPGRSESSPTSGFSGPADLRLAHQARVIKRVGSAPATRLRRVPQPLRLGQGLELLQRVVLD